MATYKVIQDIEAEDKLLGPLTLKQFIYAGVAAGFLFAAFMLATKIKVYAAIPLLPLIIIPAILAAPFGKDQPTDIWLAAQLRFLFKPRKRIWDQTDVKNLVTITAPKKVEKQFTDNLSQGEVQSRLKVLAETIDSRGWALKGVDPSIYGSKIMGTTSTDRLFNPYGNTSNTNSENYIADSADIMDELNNPVAQHFDELVKTAERKSKAAAIDKMYESVQNDEHKYDPRISSESRYQISSIQTKTSDNNTETLAQDDEQAREEEQALLKRIKTQKENEERLAKMTTPHHKIVKTPEQLAAAEAKKMHQAQAVTPLKNPDIVNLANTNDLSVSTIAGLANRKKQNSNVEGEIRLH